MTLRHRVYILFPLLSTTRLLWWNHCMADWKQIVKSSQDISTRTRAQSRARHAKLEKLFQSTACTTLPSSSLERQGQRSHNLQLSTALFGVKQKSCSWHLDSSPVLVTINWPVDSGLESLGGSQAKPTDQSISVSDYLQLPLVTASVSRLPAKRNTVNSNL